MTSPKREAQSIVVSDLLAKMTPPEDGILSVTLQKTDGAKVVLLGFAAGQGLSEHTAAVPAMMQQLQGEAWWRVGERDLEAKPGTWVSMPANLPHAINAMTPCVMLLTMLDGVAGEP